MTYYFSILTICLDNKLEEKEGKGRGGEGKEGKGRGGVRRESVLYLEGKGREKQGK